MHAIALHLFFFCASGGRLDMYMIDNLGSGFSCGTASCETGRWPQSWGTKDLAFSMRSLRVSGKEGGHGHRNTSVNVDLTY